MDLEFVRLPLFTFKIQGQKSCVVHNVDKDYIDIETDMMDFLEEERAFRMNFSLKHAPTETKIKDRRLEMKIDFRLRNTYWREE